MAEYWRRNLWAECNAEYYRTEASFEGRSIVPSRNFHCPNCLRPVIVLYRHLTKT